MFGRNNRATMIFQAKIPSADKIMNDLSASNGCVSNYFGFPVTNLE